MKTYLLSTAAAVGLAMTLTAANAEAALIEGGIGFGGSFEAWTGNDESGSTTNDLSTAASIETNDATIDVNATLGDLSAIPDGTTVDFYADFNLDGSDLPQDMWQVSFGGTTFTLALESLNVVTQDSDTIVLSGLGTLSGTGFDDTPAAWDFTGNKTSSGSFTIKTFSDSTAAIPEPATLGALGVGLIGLGWAARRRKHAA